ncbi:hypothetical protein FDG2_2176 [Candidatus Protofrankia californiensis]|uniref:Uncharacterized protein n=1 Tax=Candidatus Protofrankia californiensis TaxID=1839754 RepID=A0A1C3NX37_9ACTN|nr:hypothetical protein FDG2_2176 [Candidatus Protofrankia californiensis]
MTSDADDADRLSDDAQPPSSGESLFPAGAGEWVVTLTPSMRPAELIRMLRTLPETAEFVESFGDVDLLLIFCLALPQRAAPPG